MSTLKKIEWKFGVTASNEELKDVGSTFLQLKLDTITGNVSETHLAELTMPQFYELLHELEKVQFCGRHGSQQDQFFSPQVASGSGKSTLAKRLKSIAKGTPDEPLRAALPTVGVELHRLQFGRTAGITGMDETINVREVGGSMMPVWHKYLAECSVLQYVVDLSDAGSLALSLTTLLRVMAHPDMREKAVVVCLNKADSPSCFSEDEVLNFMRASDLSSAIPAQSSGRVFISLNKN